MRQQRGAQRRLSSKLQNFAPLNHPLGSSRRRFVPLNLPQSTKQHSASATRIGPPASFRPNPSLSWSFRLPLSLFRRQGLRYLNCRQSQSYCRKKSPMSERSISRASLLPTFQRFRLRSQEAISRSDPFIQRMFHSRSRSILPARVLLQALF